MGKKKTKKVNITLKNHHSPYASPDIEKLITGFPAKKQDKEIRKHLKNLPHQKSFSSKRKKRASRKEIKDLIGNQIINLPTQELIAELVLNTHKNPKVSYWKIMGILFGVKPSRSKTDNSLDKQDKILLNAVHALSKKIDLNKACLRVARLHHQKDKFKVLGRIPHKNLPNDHSSIKATTERLKRNYKKDKGIAVSADNKIYVDLRNEEYQMLEVKLLFRNLRNWFDKYCA